MSPASGPQIERYVDRLVAPLRYTVDPERLDDIRANALFHLEALVEEKQGEDDPVAAAIQEFGSADTIGLALLDEWCRGRRSMTFAKSGPSAVWWSFAIFGMAEAVALLLTEATAMWPGGFGWKPFAQVALWASPFVAGVITGWLAPTGNLRALALALLPIAIHASLAAWLMNPYLSGADFAVPPLLPWAPIGAVSLAITAWIRRHRPTSCAHPRLGATS